MQKARNREKQDEIGARLETAPINTVVLSTCTANKRGYISKKRNTTLVHELFDTDREESVNFVKY